VSSGFSLPASGGRVHASVSCAYDNAVVAVVWFDRGDVAAESGVKMAEDVRAEIVASVLEVVVHEGDQIGEGDTLVLLESMKMEIPVVTESAGKLTKIAVKEGDVVQEHDLIAVVE
jgi:acetyl-CoA carboxylase biotin carboxyl carrier protein